MNPVSKKNFAVFPVLDLSACDAQAGWIAEITAHIPNKSEQLVCLCVFARRQVRYYGTYSNVSRGKRNKEKIGAGEEVNGKPEIIEVAPPPVSKELKKRWSYFIRKVYETDPLVCPKCSGELRIISFLDRPHVIKKILEHLGLWEEAHAPPDRAPPEREITFDSSYSQLI